MTDEVKSLVSDGVAAPLGQVIEAVGRGVAEAQAALDAGSLAATLALYGADDEPRSELLREIGYRPTFYALPETRCELQLSLRLGGSGYADGSAGAKGAAGVALYATPVDAAFANRYAYQVSASAKLRFSIVPVPPPATLDDLRVVPDLLGLPGAEAERGLEVRALRVAWFDAAGEPLTATQAASMTVQAQQPAAATRGRSGDLVTLTMRAGGDG